MSAPPPAPPPVLPLLLPSDCESGEVVCGWVREATGSERAADLADVLIGAPLAIVGLVLLGFLVRWLLHRVVDRVVARAEEGMVPDRLTGIVGARARLGRSVEMPHDVATSTRRVQRAKTMGSLLKSVISGVVFAVAGTMVLSEMDVDIAPIIASAGILGVAFGFGAQSLVKDFLSGIFMIIEDQYGVGDVVDLGEANGTVEAVSLRVTRLRDVNGTVWYVRNGEILRVGNMSQNWARTVLDVAVGYKEDLTKVRAVLRDVAHDVWEDERFHGLIIEEPEVWGVESMTADAVNVRVTLKTAPMEQWAVAREMRERIKARFDHEGIEMPHRLISRLDLPFAPAAADAAPRAEEKQ
ncbi:mechanosensitive ion channel family protein [uncultured Nocardioides sp.]|uniref:Potassium efflux system KefA protein / Small-conductance mechanosensitive channel n=1 Tax=uncultured Nocardioides sp. TaxID=198441 RepID=A0A6J4PF47_9ACTN|nr:mechanosensitive ion channel family protein [uncultured Nocardioides sp.]CAA9414080.1 MAG: Potassium efflux system KefA protein / Small-conductance mechanosensitive channel [uncultured Nocardioides sp.]